MTTQDKLIRIAKGHHFDVKRAKTGVAVKITFWDRATQSEGHIWEHAVSMYQLFKVMGY